jgi:hypothetical protein
MKLKILSLLMTISLYSLGQHQINLKTGEKIEGEVKSLNTGVLQVAFKGNNISLNQADIESIFFSKPQGSATIGTESKGELKGVVTYYFNQNYGDKPDIGAKIYVRQADTTNGMRSVINQYQRARVCRSLIEYKTQIESCTKTLQELNADTDEKFSALDSKVSKDMLQLDIFDKSVIKVTADGNGSYSLKLNPGLYELVIVSKGRKGLTVAEALGKIEQKYFRIEAGESKVVDVRFPL